MWGDTIEKESGSGGLLPLGFFPRPSTEHSPKLSIGRYEREISRPAADTLKRLADALGVSSDYLIEGTTKEAARGRFEDRELLQHFQEIEKLPEEDKMVVKKLLEAFLIKKKNQELAAR